MFFPELRGVTQKTLVFILQLFLLKASNNAKVTEQCYILLITGTMKRKIM